MARDQWTANNRPIGMFPTPVTSRAAVRVDVEEVRHWSARELRVDEDIAPRPDVATVQGQFLSRLPVIFDDPLFVSVLTGVVA